MVGYPPILWPEGHCCIHPFQPCSLSLSFSFSGEFLPLKVSAVLFFPLSKCLFNKEEEGRKLVRSLISEGNSSRPLGFQGALLPPLWYSVVPIVPCSKCRSSSSLSELPRRQGKKKKTIANHGSKVSQTANTIRPKKAPCFSRIFWAKFWAFF